MVSKNDGWYFIYAQGRTKPGNIVTNVKGSAYGSQQQWGIAYDFHLFMDVDGDGKITDDSYNDSIGLQIIGGKIYWFDKTGAMATKNITLQLTPDENGALN